MKQALSILLLTIALFNLGGYGLFMACLQQRANENMAAAIDNNTFDTTGLFSVKIPVTNLPYYTNSATYQRQDGQFEMDGTVCNYVGVRIYNDTLQMLCVPNSEIAKLRTVCATLAKLGDFTLPGQEKKPAPPAKAFKFFPPFNFGGQNISAKKSLVIFNPKNRNRPTLILPFYYVAAIEDPPEA